MAAESQLETLALRALGAREAEGLLRSRHANTVKGAPSRTILVGDRVLSNFASNGYLGLSTHPEVVAAARAAVDASGCSSSSSRLIAGNSHALEELEIALAELVGAESALVFSSGYLANLGVLFALGEALTPDRPPVILSDEANHASIIDGCRLSRAEVRIYPHRDMTALGRHLDDAARENRRTVIVSETRFSMDGDVAPVARIAELARSVGAAAVFDEAHAIGVDGEGRGLVHAARAEADLVVGTLGKALGAHGAFVAGKRALVAWIENAARAFVFTTGLPPSVAAAAHAAVAITRRDHPERSLWRNVERFRNLLSARHVLDLVPAEAFGPIFPIEVGSPERALALGAFLREHGALVGVLRPPTVPRGRCRVRISIRADHEEADLESLAELLSMARERGLVP